MLYLQSVGGTARLIQIPLRITLPLDVVSLTGFLNMLLTMMKFYIVMLNKVQGKGMFMFSKIWSEPHLKSEQRVSFFFFFLI